MYEKLPVYARLRTALLSAALLVTFSSTAFAQEQKPDRGILSGSFETNTIWYVPDDWEIPNNRIGSNNYLKLDYNRKKLSVGVQFELYAPVLVGYNSAYRNDKIFASSLVNKYVQWTDKNFQITAGDYYDQFGSGMIYRSYEDRALGINNALEGARLVYNFGDYAYIKGIAGRPRMYMEYADSWIYGADASVSLSNLFGMKKHWLAIEGSFVNRYEKIPMAYEDVLTTPNMHAWSGRIAYESDFGLTFKAEYAGKSRSPFEESLKENDYLTEVYTHVGNGQLVELGYNRNGLGIFATYRRLTYMAERFTLSDSYFDNNVMNYLPALTRQYTYLLTNLNPYSTNVNGEQGGQVDIYYSFKRRTALGGRYGWKIHLNGSMFYTLHRYGEESRRLNRDFSIDIDKQWTKNFKTLLLVSYQGYRTQHVIDPDETRTDIPSLTRTSDSEPINPNALRPFCNAWVFVLDMQYKFTPKVSLRLELQYLYSKDDVKDWWAALAELNFAPNWSVWGSDMYNYKYERKHYYTAGFSYTKSRTRISLTYGHNRAGYICSGGVCRMVPEYAGANLQATISF